MTIVFLFLIFSLFMTASKSGMDATKETFREQMKASWSDLLTATTGRYQEKC